MPSAAAEDTVVTDHQKTKTSIHVRKALWKRWTTYVTAHTDLDYSESIESLIEQELARREKTPPGEDRQSLDVTGLSPDVIQDLQTLAGITEPDEYERDVLSLIGHLRKRREKRGRPLVRRLVVHSSPEKTNS